MEKEVIKILEKINMELKGIRAEMRSSQSDTCGPEEALAILGYRDNRSNRGYLQYFSRSNIGLLTRSGNRRAFVYSKNECTKLAEMIKTGVVKVPPIKYLYN